MRLVKALVSGLLIAGLWYCYMFILYGISSMLIVLEDAGTQIWFTQHFALPSILNVPITFMLFACFWPLVAILIGFIVVSLYE
jgi:hypothetical protein